MMKREESDSMDMKRVLLKLSGEALAGSKKTGFDEETVRGVARQVKQAVDAGVEVGIVTGGGNFWRGRTGNEIDRTKADQIGMLATVMNCIYVSEIFRGEGMDTVVMTPFQVGAMTELFSKDKAVEAFKAHKVVFFAGGTGHPYFSTDTGAALRAVEIEADCMLLAKAVDGVYDSDPKTNPNARKFDRISIAEVVEKHLQVVDMTASVICEENHMPLVVFGLNEENGIANALKGKVSGTIVTAD
nr:UMP kinase [[Clostridium] aminophilum]